MKKKISVISLILLFFISTIGLPLSMDLCSMMDTAEVGMCEMHSKENGCKDDDYSVSSKLEFQKPNCCTSEVVDKSITDQYLRVDSQNQLAGQEFTSIMFTGLINNYIPQAQRINNFSGSSPPTFLDNCIYLDNSVLLI